MMTPVLPSVGASCFAKLVAKSADATAKILSIPTGERADRVMWANLCDVIEEEDRGLSVLDTCGQHRKANLAGDARVRLQSDSRVGEFPDEGKEPANVLAVNYYPEHINLHPRIKQ